MKITDIRRAILKMRNSPEIRDLRAWTYISTYPSILSVADGKCELSMSNFHQIALMAYGWMPRIIRIDQNHQNDALKELQKANAENVDYSDIDIELIGNCLHSIVGASKLLHFVNPKVFPIWDSKIEKYRKGGNLAYKHMSSSKNYYSYLSDVHELANVAEFPGIYQEFNTAFCERLSSSNIPVYPVSQIRAIEYSIFEIGS